MGYIASSFTAGQQPTTAQWNQLWSNDASFNDGTGIGAGAIGTTQIAAAAVTSSKLATGALAARVSTIEGTASTTYTDLTTITDTVTVTIGANGLAFVSFSAFVANSSSNNYSNFVSFAASGANTIAASDTNGAQYQIFAANAFGMLGNSGQLFTGLSAGSTTFKLKYRVAGGTGSFSNRVISVIPL